MRPLFATFLLLAVLVTGALVAVDLAMLLANPGDQHPHLTAPDASSNDVRLIHAFYEAANQVMAGAGDKALSTVAAPRIELHHIGPPQGGNTQVAAYFAALSRTGPLQFHVARIVSDETGYLVMVDVAHASSYDSVSGERNLSLRWTTTDRFEIAQGLIEDYWPGRLPMPAMPPLPQVHLERIPRNAVSALARLELAPSTSQRALQIPAQQLLIVESGEVVLESREPVRVSRGGAPWRDEQMGADPTEKRILAPGDAVLAPDGGLRLSNRQLEPASLLSVLIASRDELYGPKHALSDDLLVAIAMHDPKRLASPSTWASGVTSTALAVANLPVTAFSLDVSSRTVSLAPGQQCAACTNTAVAFAIVTAGFLEIALDNPSDASATSTPSATATPSARLLWPGDATTLNRDAPPSLENAGPSELTVSLIELIPSVTLATPPPS
jgi:hypothetical protein